MTNFSLTKSRFLVAGLYRVPLQALPRDNLNIYHDAIITSFDWYKLVERTLERRDIYIYIYIHSFSKGSTFQKYLSFVSLGEAKEQTKGIYIYIFFWNVNLFENECIYICCVKKRYRKKAVFLQKYIFVKKQLFYIKMTLFYKDRFFMQHIYLYIYQWS